MRKTYRIDFKRDTKTNNIEYYDIQYAADRTIYPNVIYALLHVKEDGQHDSSISRIVTLEFVAFRLFMPSDHLIRHTYNM